MLKAVKENFIVRWRASAPANIALIKYMGKENASINLPMNASLSYTLPQLLTTVEIETSTGTQDQWEPLEDTPEFTAPPLSSAGQNRFLKHLLFLKNLFHYNGTFIVRSANNFPQGTGLASSASSFSALTQCACTALSALTHTPLPSIETQAQWSRQGSGSSCRSFHQPWVLWEGNLVRKISLPYQHLEHQVILIEAEEKKVSSSEAHQRIYSSPHYKTRKTRAEAHLHALLEALQTQKWRTAYEICWREFQDMHELFHTAEPAFSYITPQAKDVLDYLKADWEREKDGPIITMDAGPNIHLLYRPDQNTLKQKQRNFFSERYHVL
jgi:diphosphomevalonate decarboxylase